MHWLQSSNYNTKICAFRSMPLYIKGNVLKNHKIRLYHYCAQYVSTSPFVHSMNVKDYMPGTVLGTERLKSLTPVSLQSKGKDN